MIKAVLLDLDETLLRNPPKAFVKAYIQDFIATLCAIYPQSSPDDLQQALLQATQRVIENQDLTRSNLQVFLQEFSERSQRHPEESRAAIETMLQERYPALQSMTEPIASASPLVEWLLDHNYAVAIATNPLFPASATRQRVQWAGIDPERIWFITSMDTVHFTKPHAAYYEEILTRIGFETDEAIMVGDDWFNDILPAAQAGMHTFWVQPASTEVPTTPHHYEADATGTLDDFFSLITEQAWLETRTPPPLKAEQIASRLMGNTAALHGLIQDIPLAFWHQHPDPVEWSPIEILVHLLESEIQNQRPRLLKILNEDNPFLNTPPTPPAPHSRDLLAVNPKEIMEKLAAERLKTLALLAKLTEAQWIRPARHSVFGPTNLLEMAAFTARHDRLHINQLCQTIGKCQ